MVLLALLEIERFGYYYIKRLQCMSYVGQKDSQAHLVPVAALNKIHRKMKPMVDK